MCAYMDAMCQVLNTHQPNHHSVSNGTLANIYQPAIWRKKQSLICSICQFLWCKYTHHGQLQDTNGMSLNTELGRAALNLFNLFYKPVRTHSSTLLPVREVL